MNLLSIKLNINLINIIILIKTFQLNSKIIYGYLNKTI